MKKKLITLESDLYRVSKQYDYFNTTKLNGIACPKCGEELCDRHSNIMLMSHPPQKDIYCPKCDYKGLRFC